MLISALIHSSKSLRPYLPHCSPIKIRHLTSENVSQRTTIIGSTSTSPIFDSQTWHMAAPMAHKSWEFPPGLTSNFLSNAMTFCEELQIMPDEISENPTRLLKSGTARQYLGWKRRFWEVVLENTWKRSEKSAKLGTSRTRGNVVNEQIGIQHQECVFSHDFPTMKKHGTFTKKHGEGWHLDDRVAARWCVLST